MKRDSDFPDISNIDESASDETGSPYYVHRHQTRDADELADYASHLDQVYEQITPGQFNGLFFEVGFRNINLFRESTNQSTYQAGVMTPGARMFAVAASMTGHGAFCGHQTHRGMLASIEGGTEFDQRTAKDFDVICLAVPDELLTAHTAEREREEIVTPAASYPFVPVSSTALQRFRGTLITLQQAIALNPSALRYEAIQKGFEHAVLSAIVDVYQGVNRVPERPPALSVRHSIALRAREFMRAHVEEPITVEDLCAALGISRRTLQYSFEDVFQVNPAAYLRAFRLNGVRRALRRADPARDSVQDIAARWGFWHLSRFAQYYREMFGELPSDTLYNKRILSLRNVS